MTKGETIEGLRFIRKYEANFAQSIQALDAAISMLAAEEFTDQDREDLDIIHRVREGGLKKCVRHDYVIFNGEWYREHVLPVPVDDGLMPREDAVLKLRQAWREADKQEKKAVEPHETF